LYLKYKNTIKQLSGALLAALFLLNSGALLANEASAITAITGYVTVTALNGDTKRLALGDKLKNGDVVNTGNESSVSITLANGEVVTLGGLARYTVGGQNDAGGGAFANRSLSDKSPTLSTATSAGGGIVQDNEVPPVTPTPPAPVDPPAPTPPTTPPPGGSPSS
jgi:hypothetical protein